MTKSRPGGASGPDPVAVAIIGAGPYGLSLAAHLHARGVDFRIFGRPMQSWREGMPEGMHLKSDGFASDLYDPARRFTLERYCAERRLPYDHLLKPVPLKTFVDYGLAFQSACVPSLEDKLVTGIRLENGVFQLTLEDGSTAEASKVVVATGVSHLGHLPEALTPLGSRLCTHSSAHHDLSEFAGRRVLVIGGGASATDVAALLSIAGASVELVSRRAVEFHRPPPPEGRSRWQRIRRPHFGLGPSLRSALYTIFPGLFQLLPPKLRLRIVRRHLGPAGGWFIRDLISQRGIPVHEGYSLQSAAEIAGKAALLFRRADGSTLERQVDHVIAATGYRASLERLAFLDPALRQRIRTVGDGYPRLSAHFESTVPGLHFVGLLSAGSFGPLARFALGARFTARRLSAHLSANAHPASQVAVPRPASPGWPEA